MTTIERQAPATDAELRAGVEEQMGKILTELGGALGVLLTALGTRSGLWVAMAGAGPLTVDQVAAKVTVDPALVREWLRAQAAGGYLDYDPDTDRYTLTDAVAGAIVYGPGGPLVDAAATMMSSMGEGFADFSQAFRSGRGYGWHQRTADHWHGTDAFTKVALPTELIAAPLDEMTDVAEALTNGGAVVDVGCGYGTPTCPSPPATPPRASWVSITTTPRSPTPDRWPHAALSATPASRWPPRPGSAGSAGWGCRLR
jgi:hypothetical protein